MSSFLKNSKNWKILKNMMIIEEYEEYSTIYEEYEDFGKKKSDLFF
jgi:hypothetical protein